MHIVTRLVCFVWCLTLSLPVWAQDKTLPRVLVIGDTVYVQQMRDLPKALSDRAEVVFADWPKDVVANSTNALQHLDQLLGRVDASGKPVPEDKRPAWDLIHVNVGLGDLIHVVPAIDDFRVLPIHAGGVAASSPEQYRKNLVQLIAALQKTKAKLVWASTTPIRHSRSNIFRLGSEIEYNAIAAEVMVKHGVQTNDMYTFVKHLIDMDKPASHGADPFNFDKKPIHMPVVRVIEQQFGLEPMPISEEEKAVKAAMQSSAVSQN